MKSASGPGGTGSFTRSLVDTPVRHHGQASTNAKQAGARNTHRSGRFTSPLDNERGFELGRPHDPARPGPPTNAPQGARSAAQRHQPTLAGLRAASEAAWVLHDSRGNTFRFVVCRSSIQGAMALQLRVSNHWRQPYEDRPFDRKVGGIAGGGESSARSGWCQPARRTTGRRTFLDASNREEGSIEVVW